MFSTFRQERDDQGREVIEMGLDLKRARIGLMAAPVVFVLIGYFAMGRSVITLIVMTLMLAFLLAAFAVIGFPAMAMMAKRSQLRVTLDGKAGKILVATGSGESELRMADLARAEFGSTVSTSTDSDNNTRETTVYRLEFVKKSGERVPATASYSNAYSPEHQRSMAAAINAALGRQMV
jgi:hypothetical protein